MSIKVAILNLEQSIAHCVNNKDFARARALIEVVETLSGLPPGKDELTASEIATLKTQGLVATVKDVRARTGMGLKESKDLVDGYIQRTGLTRVETGNGYAR